MAGYRIHYRWLILLAIVNALYGCFLPQVYDETQKRLISLKPDDLKNHGIAFITPSTTTGQEEEKQGIALIFAEVLKKDRPGIPFLSLPETLNAINKAGLAEDYRRMFADYRDTGVFNRDILRKVGQATNTKYVAQLKLMTFSQGTQGRLAFLGLRLVETKSAHIRLFFQIWDTDMGSIAWEGVQELHYAVDTISEKTVTEKIIVEKAARDFIAQLP